MLAAPDPTRAPPRTRGSRTLLTAVLGNAVPVAGVLFLQWRVVELLTVFLVQGILTAIGWAWLVAVHERLTLAPEHRMRVRVRDRTMFGPEPAVREVSYARYQLLGVLILAVWVIASGNLVLMAHRANASEWAAPTDLGLALGVAVVMALVELGGMRRKVGSFSFLRLQMHARLAKLRMWALVAAMFAATALLWWAGPGAIEFIVLSFLLLRFGVDLWGVNACARIAQQDEQEDRAIDDARRETRST